MASVAWSDVINCCVINEEKGCSYFSGYPVRWPRLQTGEFFFLSVALASLANSTDIRISCLGIAFGVIRLLISCLSSSLPPDVFFWFTLTLRSLHSVYVCFCVLSKIPNDSLYCPLLVESFPVLTYIFLLNASVRIFLRRIAVILQGVNKVLSVCIYACVFI